MSDEGGRPARVVPDFPLQFAEPRKKELLCLGSKPHTNWVVRGKGCQHRKNLFRRGDRVGIWRAVNQLPLARWIRINQDLEALE